MFFAGVILYYNDCDSFNKASGVNILHTHTHTYLHGKKKKKKALCRIIVTLFEVFWKQQLERNPPEMKRGAEMMQLWLGSLFITGESA